MRCLITNETIVKHHVRHISMPAKQTINEIFMLHYLLLNITIQSHSAKNGYCN